MLARLQTDYVDLLFLHQPTDNWKAGYRNIEKAVKEGKVRSIGLSNFPEELLREAIDWAEIKPQVVQVEAHPYFPQTELKKILAETGMGLMAWSPIGHGDKNLIGEPVFTELAVKYGKSNIQIILRWHIQSGNVVFPGSKNPDHIRDNFDIFDFSLTDEEMAAIAKVDKGSAIITQHRNWLRSMQRWNSARICKERGENNGKRTGSIFLRIWNREDRG